MGVLQHSFISPETLCFQKALEYDLPLVDIEGDRIFRYNKALIKRALLFLGFSDCGFGDYHFRDLLQGPQHKSGTLYRQYLQI